MKHIYAGVIVPASVLLPIGAGLIKKVYRNSNIKIILLYLIFATVTETVAMLTVMQNINNLPLLHFYTIVEFLFILRYFQLTLNSSPVQYLIKILMYSFPTIAILDFVFIQNIFQFNSYPRSIAALIIVAFCMYYFFIYTDNEAKRKWSTQPLNWITAGLLIYFCNAFLYFAFLNIIHQKASLAMRFVFGDIHATLVMLMYILFSIGFLQVKNER
jgi:hypothetical protein